MTCKQLLSLSAVVAFAMTASPLYAKDKVVQLEECPAPVQGIIKKYQAQGTLEEIGMDEKKKSGGPAVYEAKFALASGKRVEVHISAAGEVMKIEEKKAKKDEPAS